VLGDSRRLPRRDDSVKKLKDSQMCGAWWLTSVILAIPEVAIGRISVQG
jgi:hypothetical protein